MQVLMQDISVFNRWLSSMLQEVHLLMCEFLGWRPTVTVHFEGSATHGGKDWPRFTLTSRIFAKHWELFWESRRCDTACLCLMKKMRMFYETDLCYMKVKPLEDMVGCPFGVAIEDFYVWELTHRSIDGRQGIIQRHRLNDGPWWVTGGEPMFKVRNETTPILYQDEGNVVGFCADVNWKSQDVDDYSPKVFIPDGDLSEEFDACGDMWKWEEHASYGRKYPKRNDSPLTVPDEDQYDLVAFTNYYKAHSDAECLQQGWLENLEAVRKRASNEAEMKQSSEEDSLFGDEK